MGKNDAAIGLNSPFYKSPTSTPGDKFDGLRGQLSLR